MHVAAIIVAGGKGERVGARQPKQFIDLGHGRTMLEMSLDVFRNCASVHEIIVAVPPGFADRVATSERVRVVEGGARRQDSMANAFAQVSPEAEVVLVHDAARPFVSEQVIRDTIAAAAEHGAAITAVPVRDTVKRASRFGPDRTIEETLPRDAIFLAQTPQGFRRDLLQHALAAAGDSDVTDEAMLVERAGIQVHIVEGDPANVKITTAEDMERLKRAGHGDARVRIGTGYDLHRLVPGRKLILAGVPVPFDLGLAGHSDADIVCHAVTDAILGAAALGDIGRMFPDTDPKWKDADSIELLQAAVEVVRREQYEVSNVDVTVIAQRPKLVPHVNEMRAKLAAALGTEVGAVSVKAKTNEQVDATGRGEAMACHAVALLRSR
jgi:2-C-methyl-D-erythritol 4-phosphate cytidylyltransferase/2-C-methyl-D-erythritol 2,4-cyclodiphosphate synthase